MLMKKNNEKGQALIELIIFLPLMFMFYSMISGFANAINGSINQQKIARSYFYYRLQNNSTIPKPDADGVYKNWSTFGMFFIGWKDYFESEKPVAPCYQLTIPLKANETDTCKTKYSTPSSLFIRVQTVYGACGATYQNLGNYPVSVPDFNGGDYPILISEASCLISQ
jgi:hypothetical protein